MELWKYSNGLGHLVMSLFFGSVGVFLIAYPTLDPSMRGVGVGILMTVAGAWFVPGAAKQVAYQVEQVTSQSVPTTPTSPNKGTPPAAIILPDKGV